MWKKQRKSSLPKEWSEALWNDIFGSPWFRLIVEGYRFRAETSDTTRVLGEPGRASHVTDVSDDESDVSDKFSSYGSRSKSYVTREYFGRLGHLDASNPASSMPVRLSWQTQHQMVGVHEWWHWGHAIIPRKSVYGWVNPVQRDDGVSLGVILGTDNAGEALFEQLFLRSKISGSNPLHIDAKMTTIPNQDSRIGLISQYSVEHSIV